MTDDGTAPAGNIFDQLDPQQSSAPSAPAPVAGPMAGVAASGNIFDQLDPVPVKQTVGGAVQAVRSGGASGLLDVAGMPVAAERDVLELGKAAVGASILGASPTALPDGMTLTADGKAALTPDGKMYAYVDPVTGDDTYRSVTSKVPIPDGATPMTITQLNAVPKIFQPEDYSQYSNDTGSPEWLKQQTRDTTGASAVDVTQNTAANRLLHGGAEAIPAMMVGSKGSGVSALKTAVAGGAAGVAAQEAQEQGAGPGLQSATGLLVGALTHGVVNARAGGGAAPETAPGHELVPTAPSGGYTAEELMGAPSEPPPAPGGVASATETSVAPNPTPGPARAPLRLTHQIDEDTGQHTVSSDNGSTIAQEDGKHLKVIRDDTAPAAQGQGEASARWKSLGDEADARGLTMASDTSVSPAEIATMARYAARNGGQEIQVNSTTVNPDTGNVISNSPNVPAFEIKPEPAFPMAPVDSQHLQDAGIGGGLNLSHPQAMTGISAAKGELTPEQNAERTNQLRTDLQQLGAPYSPTLGQYKGSREPSFMVASPDQATRGALQTLANKYGQESVLHVEPDQSAAFHYADGRVEPAGQWTATDHATARTADGWTRGPGKQYYTLQPKPEGAQPTTNEPLGWKNQNQRGSVGTVPGKPRRAPEETPGGLTFRHFSDLTTPKALLDPSAYGTGLRGEEARRIAGGAPKVIAAYAADHPNNAVEPDLRGKTEYQIKVPAKSMYDLSKDPAGLIDKASRGGVYDHSKVENMIKGRGYVGYHIPDAEGDWKGQARFFKPVTATRVGLPGALLRPQSTRPLSVMRPGERGGPPAPTISADEARVRANLTPEEQKQMNRSDMSQRIIQAFHEAPPTEELAAAALAGKAKRGWYDQAAKAISDTFQEDAPRFSALLASMSPQTSVEMNFHNALRTFLNWDAAGRPTDPAQIHKIMGESVLGSKQGGSVLDAWKNNSVRSLQHPAPDTLTLSGPKVNSFMANLHRRTSEVTLDSWMGKFADMNAAKFGGSLRAKGGPGKSATYLGYSAKIREAAQMLTEKTGEKWTPAEVQETVWSWAKTATEQADSYKGLATIPELVRSKEITDEHIRGTTDFAGLFSEPGHANAIANSRFANNAAAASGAPSAPSAAAARPSEAGSSLAQTLQPHLENAAERLEKVRTAEEAKAVTQGQEPAPKRLAEILPGQRGGPKFTAPAAGASGVQFPPPPEVAHEGQPGVERSPKEQALAADTLRAVGLNETRQSAITGNWREGGNDWQTSQLKNEAGDRMAGVLNDERGALTDYARDLTRRAGGTPGLDRGSNKARGAVIAKPVNSYDKALEAQTQQQYEAAKIATAGKAVATPGVKDLMTNYTSEFLGTTDGKQLLEGLRTRARELGITDKNGEFQNAPIERLERLRQYAVQQWKPQTSRLVGAIKGTIDEDVTQAAGGNAFEAGRNTRALRSKMLEEPEGISQLLDPPDRLGINRAQALEDIPDYVTNLDSQQFDHVVSVLKKMGAGNKEIAGEAAGALNEIRSQFANKVLEAGSKNPEAWDQKAVNKYLNDNLARMQNVFRPEEIQRFKTLNAAGNYLHVNRRYPGAAAQAHNFWVQQVLGKLQPVLEAGGAHAHGLTGMLVGKTAGHTLEKGSAALLKRAVEKRIVKL